MIGSDCVFNTFRFQIARQFRCRDHGRAGTLGDCHRISHVIVVRMSQDDRLWLETFGAHGRHWIATDERVD